MSKNMPPINAAAITRAPATRQNLMSASFSFPNNMLMVLNTVCL
jgi:hypothetical protein